MAIELGAAYVSILPSTDKIAPGIRSALKDGQAAADREGRATGRRFGDGFKHTLGGIVKKGALGLTAGASLLGGAGLKTYAELEQSRIGFETMLGSAKKAESFLAQIKDTAAKTPFELPGLTQAAQKMLAFGFSVKDVIPTLTTLGDAASGLGVGQEGLNRIILAVGQIQAKGRVQSEELLQLTESGIPAMRILANGFGLSTVKMQEMVTKGLVPANKAIPLLLAGIKNGTKGAAGETAKFGGLMEKQSKSLTGLASTLKDTVLVGLADAIEPLAPMIKEGLSDSIERLGPLLKNAASGMRTFVAQMKSGEGTGGAVADTLKTIWTVSKGVVDTFQSLPGPVKKYGIELGIAYLVMRRFQTGISPLTSSLNSFSTSMQTATGRAKVYRSALSNIGSAARTAAGAGGVTLLAESSKKAGSAMGLLGATAGGAMLGFSIGGPWGAAIGAGAGAIYGLATATGKSNDEFRKSVPFHNAFKSSLDQVTGSITQQSREIARRDLLKSGGFNPTRMLGIPDRAVIDAALGSVKDIERIRARINAAVASGQIDRSAAFAIEQTLQRQIALSGQAAAAIRRRTVATANYGELLRGLPKKRITEIETRGLPTTFKGLKRLDAQLNLTPKEVKTIIGAVGIPVTKKQLKSLLSDAKDFGKKKSEAKVGLRNKAQTTAEIRSLDGLLTNLARPRTATITVRRVGGQIDGARAAGGPVSAGRTYLVGENGAELLTMGGTSGRIIPNHALAASPREIPEPRKQTRSGRSELVITNWKTGEGYMREIASDTYSGESDYDNLTRRMH